MENKNCMPELTKREIRQIKRYGVASLLFSPTVKGCFLMMLVSWILVFIDDFFLKSKLDHSDLMFYVMATLAGICVVVFTYCFLGPFIGKQGKKWKRILKKLEMAQNSVNGSEKLADAVRHSNMARYVKNSGSKAASAVGTAGQIAGTAELVSGMSRQSEATAQNSYEMAVACGLKMPRFVGRYMLTALLLPSVLVILFYVPMLHQTVQENHRIGELILSQMDQLESVMGGDGISVFRCKPEKRDTSGSYISFDSEDAPKKLTCTVKFSKTGYINQVSWRRKWDETQDREENLQSLLESIRIAEEKILSTDVIMWQKDRESLFTIPESLVEEFLQTPEGEEASCSLDQEIGRRWLSENVWNNAKNDIRYSIEE